MNLGLLAPLFAAGLALVAIPWLIHRIRRPVHKPVRFGSLMFVPPVRRDILRRRKIEHPWLMLLRMLLLALLAAAFMRPFWLTPASAAGDGRAWRHVILLDTSASMRTQGWFETARAEAERLLSGMGAQDEVAVVAFAGSPRLLAPLADARDAGAGTVRRAREAIRSARPGYEATNYLPALQAAETLLLPDENDNPAPARETDQAHLIVHLVTDFQRSGMPETAPPWKLDPRIELHAVEVGEAHPANAGVVDLALDDAPSRGLRVRGKVANWRERDGKPVDVTLVADGAPQAKQSVAVKPGNTPQVIFTLPSPARGAVEGWLELPADALDADNRHYFAWNPPPRRDLLLVADGAPANARSAARFAQLALPDGEVPWSVREAGQDALPSLLADPARAPEIVLAADLNGLHEPAARALIEFVRRGGGALLMLNSTLNHDAIETLLGAPLEVELARDERNAAPFATFAWVDLDHAVFIPFRDARHSDFSAIRLTDYHRLTTRATTGTEAPRVLARLDNGDPAIIEAAIGEGRMQLWTFGLDLESTNLPRLATFVPLLHESLASLTRAPEGTPRRLVGERLSPPLADTRARERWSVKLPGRENPITFDAAAPQPITLDRPGFLRWTDAATTASARVEAVNIDPREADPRRIDPAEFRLRLASPPLAAAPGVPAELAETTDGYWIRREFGRELLYLLLAFLILESFVALRLAEPAAAPKVEAPS